MARIRNQSAVNIDDFALVLTDNGNGGLLHGKTPVAGSVDYGTGEIRVDTNALKGRVNEPQYSNYQITQSASNTTGAIRYRETADVFISDASATVSAIKSGDTRDVTQTVDTGLQTYDLLGGKANPKACLLNTWVFDIGGIRTIERNGTLYQNWDAQTGTGRVVGSLNSAGLLSVTAPTLAGSTVKVLQGVYVNGTHDVKEFVGRTATAPVKPMSFTAYADISADETLTGTAQRDETITGSLHGRIDSKTGFFSIQADKPIAPESLRYNAVSQTTVQCYWHQRHPPAARRARADIPRGRAYCHPQRQPAGFGQCPHRRQHRSLRTAENRPAVYCGCSRKARFGRTVRSRFIGGQPEMGESAQPVRIRHAAHRRADVGGKQPRGGDRYFRQPETAKPDKPRLPA